MRWILSRARSAFRITDTELSVIAALAQITEGGRPRFVAAAVVGWALPAHGSGLPRAARIREAFLHYLGRSELLDAQATETGSALALSHARYGVIAAAAARRQALGTDPGTLAVI